MEHTCEACQRKKSQPRDEKEIKDLKNRINRIVGQLNGVSKMLDENRYCADILTQIAASEAALRSLGYVILQEHIDTCVVEDVKNNKTDSLDEAIELMKKLK